jgi:tetratricopeptide (TPR) repeat protein
MVPTLLRAAIFASAILALGCAPWANKPATEYVTVASDSDVDASEARKLYDKARKEMAKQVGEEKCDLPTVEKLLQQALASDVRFGPAHHSLGVLYFWQNKLYLAAWEFEYAARLMPDRFEPLNNLGLVYEAAGKLEQAKMYYSLARQKGELQPQVIGNQARIAMRSGQTVDDIRPLLEDVVATDSRPEWRHWAKEQLGLHPSSTCPDFCAVPGATIDDSMSTPTLNSPEQTEELPLITPPMPSGPNPSDPMPTDSVDGTIRKSFELQPSLDLDLGAAYQKEMARK